MRRAVLVALARGAAVALALAGCSTTGGQPDPLANLDSCVNRQDAAYLSMREQALTVMAERGLDLSEALTGLEAAAKIRTNRAASLSSEDSKFLSRHGFFGLYTTMTFSPARFAALRTCLEERHGMKIRTIEVRAP
jgi:hypothetical protein